MPSTAKEEFRPVSWSVYADTIHEISGGFIRMIDTADRVSEIAYESLRTLDNITTIDNVTLEPVSDADAHKAIDDILESFLELEALLDRGPASIDNLDVGVTKLSEEAHHPSSDAVRRQSDALLTWINCNEPVLAEAFFGDALRDNPDAVRRLIVETLEGKKNTFNFDRVDWDYVNDALPWSF